MFNFLFPSWGLFFCYPTTTNMFSNFTVAHSRFRFYTLHDAYGRKDYIIRQRVQGAKGLHITFLTEAIIIYNNLALSRLQVTGYKLNWLNN